MSTRTDQDWKPYASSFVLSHARGKRVFSGNTLWEAGLIQPTNRRILSGVLLGLEADGLIRRVGRTDSVGGHGQPILLWELV